MSDVKTGLQLRSLVKKSGELELSLAKRRRRPSPARTKSWSGSRPRRSIPSDLGLLRRRRRHVHRQGVRDAGDAPVVTAKVPPKPRMRAMAGRLDESMPVGNEGAGVVIEAGDRRTRRRR